MTNPIARQGDKHKCSEPGHKGGEIKEGSPNVFVNNQPVARVGDKITCDDGSHHVIKDSQACLMVNGKLVARINDGAGDHGHVATGEPTVTVADGRPAIQIGNKGTVNIGKNVNFGNNTPSRKAASELPPKVDQPDDYIYYIVTAEGTKEKLTTFMWEDLTDISITDYFEEGRWTFGPPTAGKRAQEKIDEAKEAYNRQQVRDQGRAACKGKYKPARMADSDMEMSEEINREAISRLGAAGGATSSINTAKKIIIRNNLIKNLNQLHSQVKAKMPAKGGVLIEAQYQVSETDSDDSIILSHIYVLDAYPDYKPAIPQVMQEPFAIEKSHALNHWEFLFIWAVKQ